MRLLFFICYLFTFTIAKSQHFDFNDNCNAAYQQIIALRLTEGEQSLQIEKNNNPDNLIPVLLTNYIDFLKVYTSGSSDAYYSVKKDMDNRISQMKDGNDSSPYYLYTQAEIHLHSAVLHIKFGEYVACVFDIKKAVKKLENNVEKHPDFIPNYKSLGMLYTILGSIPQQYKGSLEFLGLKGDVNEGLDLLNQAVINDNHIFQHEAATVYAFMLLHIQNNPDEAWNVLEKNSFDYHNNLMDAYSYGHIGIYGTKCDKGIEALLNRPKKVNFHSFPLCDYLLGIGKTYRLDDDANTYFQFFLNENIGEDYIKSAWHKMAWNALLQDNSEDYNYYLNQVEQNGRAIIDADNQAEKEFEQQIIPEPKLLKARMLTDGNYLERAKNVLEALTVNHFTAKHHKTEYFYRLARVYDKLGLKDKAIRYYKVTIANGKNVAFYYAANAAYLLAYLYEQDGQLLEAKKNYQLCLSIDGYEYENSIHQKAEAGLNRIQ